MPAYASDFHGERHRFADLRDVLAKASHRRSGDELAGLAAGNRRAARRGAVRCWPTCRCATSSTNRWFPTRPTKSPG